MDTIKIIFVTTTTIVILINCSFITEVAATRGVRLNISEEPSSQKVYNNYRMVVVADKRNYYLNRANILKQSEVNAIFREDYHNPETNEYVKGNFKHNSSEFMRKITDVKWFTQFEERTGLHNYDDPIDKELAAGPQVDQGLCGAHLDYMIYLINKYDSSFEKSTDLNIFTIMNTFDIPKLGLSRGLNIYPGDYERCIETKLLITKNELTEAINKTFADNYFKIIKSKENKTTTILTYIGRYLGPFFGFVEPTMRVDMNKYIGKAYDLNMKYCFAGIRWPSWHNSSYYERNFIFRIASCLPETCDSRSLEYHGDKIKTLIDRGMPAYYSGYTLNQLYCLPDENSELRNPFKYNLFVGFLIFNLIWFLLISVSTIVGKRIEKKKNKSELRQKSNENETNFKFVVTNYSQQQSKFQVYLNCWSITKSINLFLKPKKGKSVTFNKNDKFKYGKNDVNLGPIDGFRFTNANLIITCHACMFGFSSYNWNSDVDHKLLTSSFWAPVQSVSPSIVDTFFVLTGFITMKSMMDISRKAIISKMFWFEFIINRYIRIMPLYLFVHWFLISTFRFLGSGPLWDYGTSHTAWSHVCRNESWLTYILALGNYKAPPSHCNHVGWYIASDMQFSLLTPILVLLYAFKPLLGHLTILSSIIISIILQINYYLHNTVDPRAFFEWSSMTITTVTDDNWSAYVNPFYRCNAYLIGIVAGYIIYRYEQGFIKKWPKWFVKFGKIFVLSYTYQLFILPYVSTLLPINNQILDLWLSSILNASVHTLSSLATAIFLLLTTTGQLPTIARLLNVSFVKPFANSALSILLVHCPLLYYRSQSYTSLIFATSRNFFFENMGWCLESIIIAIVVHVIYELPMRRVLHQLLVDTCSLIKSYGEKNIVESDNDKIIVTKELNKLHKKVA